MTATSERSPPPRGFWNRLLPYIAPALVLLAVVVPFLRFHQYSLLMPESLILIGGAAGVGILVGALSRLRPETLGPMLMALTLSVYIFYRQEITDLFLLATDAIAERTGHSAIVLAVLGVLLFLAVAAVCIALRKHLNLIVAAMFGTFVVTTIVLPTDTGGEPVEAGLLPDDLQDLPPVVHIVLDEHIGLAGLPAELPGTATAQRIVPEIYKDFALYTKAYSRFAETKYALVSMMNGDLGEDVGKHLVSEKFLFAPKENAWFDLLKDKGYAIKVYQSGWFDMCGDASLVDACYTYSFFSPNAIQRAPLSTGQRLRALAKKLFFGRGALQLEPMVGTEALDRFRSDIAENPYGVAYVVHLLTPHFGYLYDAECRLLDPSQWERDPYGDDGIYTPEERDAFYRRYVKQLICANRQMDALFAELKALGVYDDATIIVHGDHGSRLGERPYISEMPDSLTTQDMIDHFSTHLAIKAPGIAAGQSDAPQALQEVFAETFLGGTRADSPKPGEIFLRTDEEDRFSQLNFVWPDDQAPDTIGALDQEAKAAIAPAASGPLRRFN